MVGTAQGRLFPPYGFSSPQQAIERWQADNHRGRDQGVADGAKDLLAGAAEQPGAEPDADAVDRTDPQRKSNWVGGDQPGHGIAHQKKEIRSAEEQQDVGAR